MPAYVVAEVEIRDVKPHPSSTTGAMGGSEAGTGGNT